jgi:hypothetical protein
VLEWGKSGSHGTERGTVPVLADGAVVATLRASNWKEAATAQVGERSWVFRKRGRDLTGREEVDLEDAARLRAHQVSFWKGRWAVELEGTTVEVSTASRWKGTHRYSVGGRQMAESGTTGGWAPRPTLTGRPELPVHDAVFLLWFETILRRRAAAAASAAA